MTADPPETERLRFRRHEPADLDAYCAMEADPDVRRYAGGAPRPRAAAEERFRRELAVDPAERLILWAMVHKPDGRYIGRGGVYPHFGPAGPPIAGEGTLSVYLARPYWEQGLATEAGRAFLRFGFVELGLTRIVATVQEGNARSLRLLEKLGLRRTVTEEGAHAALIHHAIRREEFAGSAAAP